MIVIAWRCSQRVGVHAWPGNNSWGSQGGTYPNPTVTPLHPNLPHLEVNILINKNGRACLASFALSGGLITASSGIEGGTIRCMSPELLDPEAFGLKTSHPTKESDCYALGMSVYEVLSGRVPFSRSKFAGVIREVIEGRRPERPWGATGAWFTDDLWAMLELCWKHQPGDRPSLDIVLRCLQDAVPPLGLSSDMGVNAEAAADDQLDFTVTDPRVFYPFRSSPALIILAVYRTAHYA